MLQMRVVDDAALRMRQSLEVYLADLVVVIRLINREVALTELMML